MSAQNKVFRNSILVGLGLLISFGFLNCGKFQAQVAKVESNSSLADPGNPISNPPGNAPTPVAPPDFNSDVLNRLQLKLGPRGNSQCQLTPPMIPAFNQNNDGANVFKVCPEAVCPYHTISDALAAAPANSIIAVQAGNYHECLRIERPDITLQGRGGRPHIQHENCPPAPYAGAIIGINADRARLENLELSDTSANTLVAVSSSRENGDLTLINVYIHDAAGGIYTIAVGDVVIANSYFDRLGHMNGTDPHTAPSIGIGNGSRSVKITNTVVVHPKQQGAMFSLAALTNSVDCSIAADLIDGESERPMKFGLGLNSTLTNTVMQKGPLSIPQMLLFWERQAPRPEDQFTAKNNILISDRVSRDRDMLEFWATVPSTYLNNTFIGPGSKNFSNFPNSFSFESRELAGLAADVLPYPGAALK